MTDPATERLTILFDATLQTRRRVITASGSALLAMGVGSVLSLGSAQAQVLAGAGDQSDWRFCSRCFSMFYSRPNGDNGYAGKCPATAGAHQAQGFVFNIHYDSLKKQPVAGRDSQFDWRFCSKCFCMYWAPANPPLRCAAGGQHAAYGFVFGLPHDNAANPGQPNWRYCQKCGTLFFDDPNNPNKGACAGSGSHVRIANSFDFELPFVAGNSTGGSTGTHPPQPTSTLGQTILSYAQSHVGQCVTDGNGHTQPGTCSQTGNGDTLAGPGECTYLVQSALAASGAQPPNFSVPKISAKNTDNGQNQDVFGFLYTWGDPVGPPYQPGDVIQLAVVKLQGSNGTWETNSQHTAIISGVTGGNNLSVINQHAPSRTVTTGSIDLDWTLVRGKFQVFRPRPK